MDGFIEVCDEFGENHLLIIFLPGKMSGLDSISILPAFPLSTTNLLCGSIR